MGRVLGWVGCWGGWSVRMGGYVRVGGWVGV